MMNFTYDGSKCGHIFIYVICVLVNLTTILEFKLPNSKENLQASNKHKLQTIKTMKR